MMYNLTPEIEIRPRFTWGRAMNSVYMVVITLFCLYQAITFIGVKAERDEWRRAALNAQRQLKAEGEACPAPDLSEACTKWWFTSPDLATTRKRLCR